MMSQEGAILKMSDEYDPLLDDLLTGERRNEATLGWMERVPRLLSEIILTDRRLPEEARFYLMVRDAGYGVDDTGLEMGFPILEDVGNEEFWPTLDLVEARAVRILLALAPDLYGGLRKPMNLPPSSCIQLEEQEQPLLSAHQRMIKTEALRDKLRKARKNPEEIADLLATPRASTS